MLAVLTAISMLAAWLLFVTLQTSPIIVLAAVSFVGALALWGWSTLIGYLWGPIWRRPHAGDDRP
jgi:hypothetical protein